MPNKFRTRITATFILILGFSSHNVFAQKLYTMITQGGHFSGQCNYDVPQCGLGIITDYDLSTDSLTPAFYFTDSSGYIPDGYMIQASDGNLYGMTTAGGLNGLSPNDVIPSGGSNAGGTLFKYNFATGDYTVAQNFDAYATPGGAPVQASDGNLYGLTVGSGVNGSGSIYQYNISTNTYNEVYDLPDSSWPGGSSLMQASDGNLYGLTTSNGTYFSGTLFQFNYNTKVYTVMKNLSPGAFPYGSTLVEAPDSNLYGMTYSDGATNGGTIFQYNYRTNIYTAKKSLPRYANPYGLALTLANDSNLYGMTYGDGTHNSGTIFQYNYRTNFYTLKYDLPQNAWPWGSLMQASDGYLYGLTQKDGISQDGTLFQYNYTTNAYNVKINFNGANGAYPVHNRLVEVSNTTGIKNIPDAEDVSVSPNPTSVGNWQLTVDNSLVGSALQVFDEEGRLVLNDEVRSTKYELTASTLPSGIYYLRISNDKVSVMRKLVKI